ncbi:MAG: hypothetical protein HZC36_00730 [Armatimonadetes bacterium]|nr:hypothetical protein [Armatimonadota bacterium]
MKRTGKLWVFLAAAGLAALIASYVYGQSKAVEGMALGLASAAFGVFALKMVIGLLGDAVGRGATSPFGATVSILAFFAKIPLYIVVWRVSQKIGDPAPGCFLTGVILVYSLLVAWASTRKDGGYA